MATEILTKRYTIAEFEALPDDGNRYELVKGELVEKGINISMAGANEEHVFISTNLIGYLWSFVNQHKLGRVYGSDARYAVVPGENTVRLPDVSFVQTSRVTAGVNTMNFAPDLAVEVVSDSNSFKEIEKKAKEYHNAGGRLVWVINPDEKEVYIYRANSRQRETLTITDELDGENIVPGFKLKVSLLFD